MKTNQVYTGFDAVRYLPEKRPLRLLDVGCSDCAEGESLLRSGVTLTGIDLDEVTLREVRLRLPEARFIGADAATFKVNGEVCFDVVLMRRPDVLFQAQHWQKAFQKLPEWLQKDGTVWVTTPEQTEAAMAKNWLEKVGFQSVIVSETGIEDERFLIVETAYQPNETETDNTPPPLPNVLMWSDETDDTSMACDIRTGQCASVNQKKQ